MEEEAPSMMMEEMAPVEDNYVAMEAERPLLRR